MGRSGCPPFLKKTEKDYQSEYVLIKYLKQLIKTNDESKRIEIYKEAKIEFEKLFTSQKEKIILQFIDVLSWLTCKIENISFEQAIKNRISL